MMTDTTTAGLSPAEIASKAEEGDMDMALFHARSLLAEGKAEESFGWILRAAKDGHPVAATELGLRLIVGNGAPQDPPAGIKWIDAAIKAGFPEAVRWRALFLAAGVASPINFGGALNLLEAAAQSGDLSAQAQLICIRACGIFNDETLNAFINPPAPLLSSSAGPVPWEGVVAHQGELFEAEGELTETAVENKDKSVRRRQTTLTLKWEGKTHRVETEFQWGLGILRQEHRLGAEAAIPTPALKHISGP